VVNIRPHHHAADTANWIARKAVPPSQRFAVLVSHRTPQQFSADFMFITYWSVVKAHVTAAFPDGNRPLGS
jgi:hypothetical protein